MTEIGIYGGTFSPPHLGHIGAVCAFHRQTGCRETFVIPTSIPPHKAEVEGADGAQRLEMLRLALEEYPSAPPEIKVCDYEIAKSGKSYTYETLRHFAALYPKEDYRLNFLCGTDMFLTLDRWVNPEIIFSLARIAHIRREKSSRSLEEEIAEKASQYRAGFGADITEIECDALEISSTALREMIVRGEDTTGMLSRSVRKYIDDNHLYAENN